MGTAEGGRDHAANRGRVVPLPTDSCPLMRCGERGLRAFRAQPWSILMRGPRHSVEDSLRVCGPCSLPIRRSSPHLSIDACKSVKRALCSVAELNRDEWGVSRGKSETAAETAPRLHDCIVSPGKMGESASERSSDLVTPISPFSAEAVLSLDPAKPWLSGWFGLGPVSRRRLRLDRPAIGAVRPRGLLCHKFPLQLPDSL